MSEARTKGIIVSSIWAQDRTGVLGSGSDMLWHVPDDSAFFKRTTMGAPVIMGRASWEALGRPLPGRTNIVITSNPSYPAPGAVVVHSLDEALAVAIRALPPAEDPASPTLTIRVPTVWIAGGSRVYAEAMDRVDELVVTELDLDIAASSYAGPLVRAPHIDPAQWVADPTRSDTDWRTRSGDSRWRVTTWVRQEKALSLGRDALVAAREVG